MQPGGLHVVRHHVDAPGLPVVLVHGAPDRHKNFAHVVHQLPDMAITVYDRRGYGRSLDAAWRSDRSFAGGFDVHAADLIELLGDGPAVVCGQSAGGAIAMLAAVRAPDLFAALGVWEPPMVPWEWWAGDEPYRQTMAWAGYDDAEQLGEDFNRAILGDERWNGLRESTKTLLRTEGRAFRADMACQSAPYFDLDALKVPLLVGWGTGGMPGLGGCHQRLAERMGAEQLVGVGADHFAHTNQPGVWAGLVRRTVALAEPGMRRR